MPLPASAALFLARQTERLRRLPRKKRIVFPEGADPRVREAAGRLAREGLIVPILIEPERATDKYAALYFERRRAKGVTQMEAQEVARRPLYFAALMVSAGGSPCPGGRAG